MTMTIDPSKVDLRQLEQSILTEINKIRQNPTDLIKALEQEK